MSDIAWITHPLILSAKALFLQFFAADFNRAGNCVFFSFQ